MSTENQIELIAGPSDGQTQPVQIVKKKHHHWWQNIPRRLSFTRNRSASESSEVSAGSPLQSPTNTEPPVLKKRERRFSETLAGSREKTSEIRERWVRNYNVPAECFIPPWI